MKLDIILFILCGIIIIGLLWPERRKPRKSNTKRQIKAVYSGMNELDLVDRMIGKFLIAFFC